MWPVFSIHYFLYYAGLTCVFGYGGTVAFKYAQASPTQYGILNAILPFITVIATPYICLLADRQRSHRLVFTTSILCAFLGVASLAMLTVSRSSSFYKQEAILEANRARDPNFKSEEPRTIQIGPWICYILVAAMLDVIMGVCTCLGDAFSVLYAEDNNISFGSMCIWGTFGYAAGSLTLAALNQIKSLPYMTPTMLFGTVLLAADTILVACWPNNEHFRLDYIPLDAAASLTGSVSSSHREPSDYMPRNESAKVNMGPEDDVGLAARKTVSPVQLLKDERSERSVRVATGPKRQVTFKTQDSAEADTNTIASRRLEAVGSTVSTMSSNFGTFLMGPSRPGSIAHVSHRTLADGVTQAAAEVARPLTPTPTPTPTDTPTDTPSPRSAPVSGPVAGSTATDEAAKTEPAPATNAVKKPAADKQQPTQIGTKRRKRRWEPSKVSKWASSLRLQYILFMLVLKRRKVLLRYLIYFTVSGFLMSFHWNFYFYYLEVTYGGLFPSLSALSMASQTIFGELPFFVLSRPLMMKLGRSHTLSLSIMSIGLRYLMYRYLIGRMSIYALPLVDWLQGPNYGLFYLVMTDVGMEYSHCDDTTLDKLAEMGELDRHDRRQVALVRLSLRSTIQSIAYACYEGIGVGLGASVGGLLMDRLGHQALWSLGAWLAFGLGALNIVLELIWRESASVDNSDKDDDNKPLAKHDSGRAEFDKAAKEGTLVKLASPSGGRAGPSGS